MDEQTYEGGGGSEGSLDDTPEAPFPALGTPEFDRLNNRRAQLIDKDIDGLTTPEEKRELGWLQRKVGEAVDRRFPRPEPDWEWLEQLKARVEAGEGRSDAP